MRDELHLMELVDRYLDGSMNEADRLAFKTRAAANTELRQLVEDQRALREGVTRVPVRAAAAKAYRSYRFGRSGPWFVGAAVVAILAASTVYIAGNASKHLLRPEDRSEESAAAIVLPDTVGTGIRPLVFEIDPNADTTLITPNGSVLDIPRGAFIDSAGTPVTTPIRVTMLEAVDPLTIMKAGLSTMSGDTLLETGGMFYIDAQAGGGRLHIDPARSLTIMVPNEHADPNMKLYAGVKLADGRVDWRDPKPLKRSLVPVDISTLDFYPPGYEAKLAELGQDVMNKAFKDSLYWSMQPRLEASSNEQWEWTGEKYFVRADTTYSPGSLGRELFYTHCRSCHKSNEDLTGPALKGASRRWQGKGNIYDFVRNSTAVIKSGNEYAKELFTTWKGSIMTSHNLTNNEIAAILYFCDATRDELPGIQPAKVKAIWNARFNGTNVATHEFEERMREIHGTCDNRVLDAYIENLSKDLSEVDSLVGRMGHPMFDHFASRNDGRVALPAHAADRLRRAYEHWSRTEANAIHKAQEKFWRAQRKLDAKSDAKRADHAMAEEVRDGGLFQKELEANLDTVYKQLGYKRVPMPRSAWVVPVTSPGWWNVDKAVVQSTATRSSMSYTDDKTGRTATLTYTPLIVEVTDRSSYDELMVYLIPNKLNSYQRMKEENNAFAERLNSIFNYNLFCLGMKGDRQYAFTTPINGDAAITASLVQADNNDLRRMLRTKGALEQTLLEETYYYAWLAKDKQRRNVNLEREQLRNALLPVVFPCMVEGVPTDEAAEATEAGKWLLQ